MLSVQKINLLQAQNDGSKAQNDSLQRERNVYRKALKEIRDYSKAIAETNQMTNCGFIYEKCCEVLDDRRFT